MNTNNTASVKPIDNNTNKRSIFVIAHVSDDNREIVFKCTKCGKTHTNKIGKNLIGLSLECNNCKFKVIAFNPDNMSFTIKCNDCGKEFVVDNESYKKDSYYTTHKCEEEK